MPDSVFHDELGRRAEAILERADWDDYVTDNMVIGHLKVRQVGFTLEILDLSAGELIYRASQDNGEISVWLNDRIQSTLDTLRKHMLLDDLANV